MHGTDAINPIGSRWWRLGKVRIYVGKPIDVDDYCSGPDDRRGIRAATDAVMAAIQTLSDQQYVDEYAQRSS